VNHPLIIDVHVHTSDNKMRGLHTADASLRAIERHMLMSNIESGLVLATYFPFKKRGLCNEDLLVRLSDYPRLRAIGSLDVTGDLAAGIRELDDLARAGMIMGIKLYPGYQNFSMDSSKAMLVLELARAHGLPVTIHSGELHHCCSAKRRAGNDLRCGNAFCWIDRLGDLAHPQAMESAVSAFPDVLFVIAHMGNPHFEALRKLMQYYPNVVTDISGQFVSATDEDSPEYREEILGEMMRFLVDVPNGFQRLMFGSDFPIQSFADSIWLVEHLKVTDRVKYDIYRGNALRVYPGLAP
jgi:uncharacterized protein